MAKYTCCGMSFKNGKDISDHMQRTHGAARFAASLSCCGMEFASTSELTSHAKTSHNAGSFEYQT